MIVIAHNIIMMSPGLNTYCVVTQWTNVPSKFLRKMESLDGDSQDDPHPLKNGVRDEISYILNGC